MLNKLHDAKVCLRPKINEKKRNKIQFQINTPNIPEVLYSHYQNMPFDNTVVIVIEKTPEI